MSKHSMSFRKERALARIKQQMDNAKNDLMTRPYVTADILQSGDLLYFRYIYRVEKVTKKTITISECRNSLDNPQVYSYGHNAKRYSHDSFNLGCYRAISEKDIERSKTLRKRQDFIYEFFRKQGNSTP